MNESKYVKIPFRSNAILYIENIDKFCFLWSILAHLHPCEISHPLVVESFRQYFNELNIEGFDFCNGLRCSDAHYIQKLNIFSKNKFQLKFY